jgi:hypothetical protein
MQTTIAALADITNYTVNDDRVHVEPLLDLLYRRRIAWLADASLQSARFFAGSLLRRRRCISNQRNL